MSFGEFKSIVHHLLSHATVSVPLKSQIQISVNVDRKVISLTIPIFRPFGGMPSSVSDYVSKRRNRTFKPHSTSFEREDEEVQLVQEISFVTECQDSLRKNVVDFWEMAKRCHKMLKEIASEEKSNRILPIDLDD